MRSNILRLHGENFAKIADLLLKLILRSSTGHISLRLLSVNPKDMELQRSATLLIISMNQAILTKRLYLENSTNLDSGISTGLENLNLQFLIHLVDCKELIRLISNRILQLDSAGQGSSRSVISVGLSVTARNTSLKTPLRSGTFFGTLDKV